MEICYVDPRGQKYVSALSQEQIRVLARGFVGMLREMSSKTQRLYMHPRA